LSDPIFARIDRLMARMGLQGNQKHYVNSFSIAAGSRACPGKPSGMMDASVFHL
jgi:hypothetical protein